MAVVSPPVAVLSEALSLVLRQCSSLVYWLIRWCGGGDSTALVLQHSVTTESLTGFGLASLVSHTSHSGISTNEMATMATAMAMGTVMVSPL